MKRIIFALLLVPLALSAAYGGVNLVNDVLSGNLDLLAWIEEHKVILAFVVCYLILTFIGPFKRKA